MRDDPGRSPAGDGRLRPIAKAERIDVVRRTEAVSLAPGVVESLLRRAAVLSEGDVRGGIGGRETYFGSTMLTIDLADLAGELRATVDEELARSIAPLVAKSAHLRVHALRIARGEAERRVPDRERARFSAELRVRAAGTRIEVDVDVEMTLELTAARSRRA